MLGAEVGAHTVCETIVDTVVIGLSGPFGSVLIFISYSTHLK